MTDAVTLDGPELLDNPVHQAFTSHPFFTGIHTAPLSTADAALFIGQWWHPLHYFPTFLARCVSVLPDVASKTAVTRILDQEVGAGDPTRAHEIVYIDSMTRAGFDRDAVVAAAPFAETAELVDGYERASARAHTALGFIFATEVTDLLMVSSIGTAVERATGMADNEWVRIHVQQEPDHVEESENTLMQGFTRREAAVVLESAEEMWRLWTGFFDRLHAEMGAHV
jgi:pyrroloquinoline quinone (PQQ) biosynthesis protein C